MADCTVYIDEAGDLGINRGTDWFVLSAVIINKEDEQHVRDLMRSIKAKINIHDIHMRKLQSFNKKTYVVSELNKGLFEYVNIIVDTRKITLKPKSESGEERISVLSYNYICRYLLERVSWLLRDTGRTADIVLSARGTSRDGDLIQYIKEKLLPYEFNKVECRFEQISAKQAASWDLLQLADVCATSIFYMHQKNSYGFTAPCFAHRLRKHLYRYNGKAIRYGVKYYAEDMFPGSEYFIDNAPCQKK